MPWHIERAVIEDAGAIARVHVAAWQMAYAGIVPEDHLAALSVTSREALWREAIARGASETAVARDEDQIGGFISFGPCRDADAASGCGEIWAIYVSPAYWSRGVGRLLWLHARGRLMDAGYRTAALWVLAQNQRAILFYRAAGFKPDPAGVRETFVGGKALSQVRHVVELS